MGSKCKAYQASDQMICECGLQWDVNDPAPPVCHAKRTEKILKEANVTFGPSRADIEHSARKRLNLLKRAVKFLRYEYPMSDIYHNREEEHQLRLAIEREISGTEQV